MSYIQHFEAENKLEHIWNREIGEGESGGALMPITNEGVPGFYLSVSYESELKIEEAEQCAQEFERLAAEIRNHAKINTHQEGILKELRTSNGISLEALAEVTGMHSKVIEAVESGAIVPERVQVQKLAEGIAELIG